MNPILSLRKIEAAYGQAQVLFDISLDVLPGEVVTLLGRNGMGRSTVVKCIFNLLPLKAGEILFNGSKINGLAPYQIGRKGLSLVPEGRLIFTDLTVQENLVATSRRGAAFENTWSLDSIYDFFPRLKERRNNLGSQLSGGEQQMLAIGRALLTNPRLLVLDEATEGLAPIVRQEIWKSIAALKKEGLSLIIIDKNIGALLDLADRHYVLEKGCVVWHGSSSEIRSEEHVIHQYLGV